MRTGKRWTTLTQLPLAFSEGMRENAELLARLIATTLPLNSLDGKRSMEMLAL
jgi:hypothetical protein